MSIETDHEKVQPILADVGGNTMFLAPKRFKTGSLGWHGQRKGTIDDTRVQISTIVTVIGSRLAPVKEAASVQMSKKAGKGPRKPLNESEGNKGLEPEKAPQKRS